MTQSLELLLDDDLEAAVLRQWAALAEAGLPSAADHPGETNRPHVTLTVAGSLPAYLETAIKAALTGRLPVPIRLGGVLCFPSRGDGAGTQIITRAVVPSAELLELQAVCAELFEALPGLSPVLRPGAWSPHVTLARRMPTDRMGTALAALGAVEDQPGGGVEIRRWNSDTRTAWLVTRPRPATTGH